jgi:hypothetical protein
MMLDMNGDEKRLGFVECAHKGLELLCRFKAVADRQRSDVLSARSLTGERMHRGVGW